ncbi:hypothetical protein WDZ92_26235 [Nostoc sp. NIES-2111]
MKARITHKKAPWPEGAEVGAVVVFEAGVVPAWAAGKCVPAEEGEEPTLVVPAAAPVEAAPVSEADQVREEATQHIATLRSQFAEYAEDMQAKLTSVTAQAEALQEAKDQAEAKVAELQAELDKAKADQGSKGKK